MIDLHLHLDGSLTPEEIIRLADMQGETLPTRDKTELLRYLAFEGEERTLTRYLTYFDLPLSVLQTRETIRESVRMLVSRLAEQGMVYAEIRFAPLLHIRKGLSLDEVVESAIAGLKEGIGETKFIAQLILCAMRIEGMERENMETARLVKKYFGRGVCAFDLAGNEDGFTYDKYAELFDLVKELKIPTTIHAGERGGREQIEAAIKLGAKRIGHGVHLIECPDLMDIVQANEIGIEMCPTSNYQTGAIEKFPDYPIQEYLAHGILATVNTDSTTVSSTSIRNEFDFLKSNLNLTIEEKVKLLLNSVKIAFLPMQFKDAIRGRVITVLAKSTQD